MMLVMFGANGGPEDGGSSGPLHLSGLFGAKCRCDVFGGKLGDRSVSFDAS